MVQIIASLLGAALLFSRGVAAVPMPDSSDEAGVTSPNGTPITLSPDPTPAADYQSPTATPMMDETTMMMDTTTMMMDHTTTMMMDHTTTMMMDHTTTTMMVEATSTTPASYPTDTISYGSGNSNWNNGYDGCVQQCMNQYGAPPAQYTPPPSTTTADGSSGGGATHVVIVAPTKGVLRFVPFVVNATVGDTIHYVWGAGPHTVTKSSELEPCNKSSDAGFFNSGPQNASATFDQVVNDTNPVFFYCNVPGHCAKGMFGIVNPPNALPAATSVANMMPAMISNSTSLATMLMYTDNKTMGTSAYTWGDSIDLASVPSWAHEEVITNVLYTRLLFAANPGMLEAGNGASNPDGSPVTVPGDISQLASDSTDPYSTPAAANAGATASVTGSSASPSGTSGTSSGVSNGAGSTMVSSSLLVGVVAIVVSMMAL